MSSNAASYEVSDEGARECSECVAICMCMCSTEVRSLEGTYAQCGCVSSGLV